MKNILYFACLFLLMVAAKCEKGPTFELDQSFELKPGNAVDCNCKDKLNIQFASIKEDSRCPKNVNCVWAGQVITTLSVNGESVELTLGGKDKGKSTHAVNGHTIQLQKVSPYPEGSQKIEAADYVVELIVKSKP